MRQTATRKSFLISDSLGWYIQGLLASCENYYSLRQFERIEGIVDILESLPLTKAQQESVVCYRALVYNWRKQPEKAKSLLESIASNSGKALLFLGTLNFNALKLSEARRCYYEASKLAPGLTLETFHNIAVVDSIDGNHKGSLRQLERLLPLALSMKASQPIVYLDHLNSLAVELCEAGRIQEAGVASRIVLASPYSFAYPEWRETGADIARRGYSSRSSISIIYPFSAPERKPEKSQNVLYMPERNPAPVRVRTKPAKLLSYVDWKEKMVKDDEIPPDADEGDLYLRLMELIALKDLSAWELRQVIDFVENLRPKQGKN